MGLAFFGEGAGALFGVLAAEDRHADLGLDLEGVGLGQALGLADGAQDRSDCYRAIRRDRVGDLEGLGEGLAVGDNVADQADLEGFGAGDVAAGEQQVGGNRIGDLPGQPDRGAAQREQAQRASDTPNMALSPATRMSVA